MRAFALLEHASVIEAAYLRSPICKRNLAHFQELRRTLPPVDYAAYRGIGRTALSEHPRPSAGWQGSGIEPAETEVMARLVLADLLDPDRDPPNARLYIPTLEQLRAVEAVLESPGDYELVELCSESDLPEQLLGFDLGYWDGEEYSIICDAAIWPAWHGPVPEALPALAGLVAQLNSHLLFASRSQAECYLDWYAGQDWAEKPPEDFTIVAIGSVASERGV
jgi:hypothetical protein